MATTAFVLLLLAALAALGRPAGRLPARDLPEAVLQGVLALGRLDAQRRARLSGDGLTPRGGGTARRSATADVGPRR